MTEVYFCSKGRYSWLTGRFPHTFMAPVTSNSWFLRLYTVCPLHANICLSVLICKYTEGIALPDSINKNTECLPKFEFQITHTILAYPKHPMEHTYTKILYCLSEIPI
jgi:hypothetical protein